MWLPAIFFPVLACISLGRSDLIDDLEYEEKTFETSFETNVHVEANISYPKLPGTNPLICYVNEKLKRDAHELYDTYIQAMRVPQKDVWEEEEFNERTLHYGLQPVYCNSNLISLYGGEYQYSGGVHGSVHYITKTFWQNGDLFRELLLDDLFLPKFREWLFRYCENYFKSNRWGYYSYDDYSWVGFGPEHLDAFILTKKGVLLIFQNYVVSGFDDFPTSLLIPYVILASLANPDGPIPTLLQLDDHWMTTNGQKRATDGPKPQLIEIP